MACCLRNSIHVYLIAHPACGMGIWNNYNRYNGFNRFCKCQIYTYVWFDLVVRFSSFTETDESVIDILD
jgi:hypothetical protein